MRTQHYLAPQAEKQPRASPTSPLGALLITVLFAVLGKHAEHLLCACLGPGRAGGGRLGSSSASSQKPTGQERHWLGPLMVVVGGWPAPPTPSCRLRVGATTDAWWHKVVG